jgi:predicted transposase YbfD/YdcC
LRKESLSEARTVQKGHGRLVVRRLEASTRLAAHLDWPGLKQVCRLERTTTRRGKQTVEVQYAITSVARSRADATLLLARWRGHWRIETQLHWVRDVTLGEDQCRVKLGHAPQNLAAFRNAALALLRVAGVNEIAHALRDFAYQPRKLLRFLGIMKN